MDSTRWEREQCVVCVIKLSTTQNALKEMGCYISSTPCFWLFYLQKTVMCFELEIEIFLLSVIFFFLDLLPSCGIPELHCLGSIAPTRNGFHVPLISRNLKKEQNERVLPVDYDAMAPQYTIKTLAGFTR